MPLVTGQTLSFYEILAPLGVGGMGEVYRARDTRLDRQVAIKVLPASFAQDEERLRRFEREARTLASLNHPNVAQVFGIDLAGEECFMVMELVEGADLSTHLERGALPRAEAIDVCRQIAEGLEVAHEAGVVHRDLKPANVRITPDGVVKILDFGLAKPIGPRTDSSGTTTAEPESVLMTEEGLILGTPTYMSPEQARGRPVDRRTDVWAFGCVLFECLTGRRAFAGESFSDVLAAVVGSEPDWSALPADLPAHLRLLLERTLTKDPRQRLRDLGDARLELESGDRRPALEPVRAPPGGGVPIWAVFTGGIAALLVGLALGRSLSGGDASVAPAAHYVFRPLTDQEGEEREASLLPAGNQVVYAARVADDWNLYSQRIGGSLPVLLTRGSPLDDTSPAVSPDGNRIAFRSERDGGGIYVMGASGESPRRLTDFGFHPAWSPDGTRLALSTHHVDSPYGRAGRSGLALVDVATGATTPLEVEDGVAPTWSPDGRWIAFWAYDRAGHRDIYRIPATGGEAVRLTDDLATDWSPAWSPRGDEIVFSSDRGGALNLWSLPMDLEQGLAVGPPRPVSNGVGSGCAGPTFSSDGSRIAFTATTGDSPLDRYPFDLEQHAIAGEPERLSGFAPLVCDLSPDGEWFAYHSGAPGDDLFVMRSDGTDRRRITDDDSKNRLPIWSPDGQRLFFFSDRGSGRYQVWSCDPDGSDLLQHTGGDTAVVTPAIAPDGRRMVGRTDRDGLLFFDATLAPDEQTPQLAVPYTDPDANLIPAGWSPDGTQVLVLVLADGRASFALLSADGQHYETLVENVGPARPTWLPDGSGVLYGPREGGVALLTLPEREHTSLLPPLARGSIDGIVISADGRWLYVQHFERRSDLWLAERAE